MLSTFVIDYDFPNTYNKNKFIQQWYWFDRANAPAYVRLWASQNGCPVRTNNGNFYSEESQVDQRRFGVPVELGLVCMVLNPLKISINGTIRWTVGYVPIWEELLTIVQSCTDITESSLNLYYSCPVARALPIVLTQRIEDALNRVFMLATSVQGHTVKSAKYGLASGLIEDIVFRAKEDLEKAVELSRQEYQAALVKVSQ